MVSLLSSYSRVFITLILLYQYLISPLLKPHCRFQPTCSQYTIDVLCEFGILRGSWFMIKRILKCHPLHHGGYDPAPSGPLNTREH